MDAVLGGRIESMSEVGGRRGAGGHKEGDGEDEVGDYPGHAT